MQTDTTNDAIQSAWKDEGMIGGGGRRRGRKESKSGRGERGEKKEGKDQPVPETECFSEGEASNPCHIASLKPYRVLGSSDSRDL